MEEQHLKVYGDRSVLVKDEDVALTFREGPPNTAAQQRLRRIKVKLNEGWLENFIERSISPEERVDNLDDDTIALLTKMVDSVTSEVGRALVGLSILQLTIKALEPSQSVRLHKGGRGAFSWVDGITMRTLDKSYVTPVLRRFGLLRLNADGFMMTRSLAENYPYTKFYKAAIRGGKNEWVLLVDKMEDNLLNPEDTLEYLIGLLANRSIKFKKIANETIRLAQEYNKKSPSLSDVFHLIDSHVTQSTYSARLFEVAMHSLIQVVEEKKLLEGRLLPLCQMRTANKKHRSIGDIEITDIWRSKTVIEAWDAKYGKPYLRDEIEELLEKLEDKPDVVVVGFVVNCEPDLKEEITTRLIQIYELTGTQVELLSFWEWVKYWGMRIDINEDELGQSWLTAYVESLCQKRREQAPIDEPADEWVESLKKGLSLT